MQAESLIVAGKMMIRWSVANGALSWSVRLWAVGFWYGSWRPGEGPLVDDHGFHWAYS